MVVKEVLDEHGLIGFPKTSGSRGIHINVRIEPRWGFTEVRRAALALAREVERRDPLATTAWWKEQRHGVFLDYNQNARDRTVASAYSVRPKPDGRVSTPLDWDEVPDVEPADWTVADGPRALQDRRTPTPRSTRLSDRWSPCSSFPLRMKKGVRAMHHGPQLPQDARRAEAGPAVEGQEREVEVAAGPAALRSRALLGRPGRPEVPALLGRPANTRGRRPLPRTHRPPESFNISFRNVPGEGRIEFLTEVKAFS